MSMALASTIEKRRHITRYVIAGLIMITVLCNLALALGALSHLSGNPLEHALSPALSGQASYSNHNAKDPTLIIQLRGEMGNHLSAIAHGMGVKWYASRVFGMDLQPLLRHQVLTIGSQDEDSPKWKPTSETLRQCFPNLRSWNFDRGSTWREFYDSDRQQRQWLPPLTRKYLGYINGRPWQGVISRRDPQPAEPQDWNRTLSILQTLWHRVDRPASKVFSPSFSQSGSTNNDMVSMPFLLSESLENTMVVDQYLDHLRNLFQFDFGSCCGDQSPDEDEVVLHFRNFITELPGSDSGLEDVSPRQTAEVLLQHLGKGDKVAITTRVHNEQLQRYVDALTSRGLQVRVIEGQSGPQDFCFLLQSKKELVGNFQSTFVFWAAMLGHTQMILLYTRDSPRLRERCGSSLNIMKRRFLYNWTHTDLKDRLKQVIIPVE